MYYFTRTIRNKKHLPQIVQNRHQAISSRTVPFNYQNKKSLYNYHTASSSASTFIIIILFLLIFLLQLDLLWALDHIVDFWMFEFHVLGHGAFSAIGLFAAFDLANIFALYFAGASPYPLFLLVSIIFGQLFKRSYHVGQFLLVLKCSTQLPAELTVGQGELGYFGEVKVDSLIDIAIEVADVDEFVVGISSCRDWSGFGLGKVTWFLVDDAWDDDDVALGSFLEGGFAHIYNLITNNLQIIMHQLQYYPSRQLRHLCQYPRHKHFAKQNVQATIKHRFRQNDGQQLPKLSNSQQI